MNRFTFVKVLARTRSIGYVCETQFFSLYEYKLTNPILNELKPSLDSPFMRSCEIQRMEKVTNGYVYHLAGQWTFDPSSVFLMFWPVWFSWFKYYFSFHVVSTFFL